VWIDVCELPGQLAVSGTERPGAVWIELLLSHADGVTELVEHMATTDRIGKMGPGWQH
jgi:hypothetical protein